MKTESDFWKWYQDEGRLLDHDSCALRAFQMTQRAFDLTGDKSLLGKDGDESHETPPASSIISSNIKGFQPSPEISQEKVGASSPAWIPVGERLPEVGKRVIWGYWKNGLWKEQMMDIETPIPKAIGWTHWHEVVILPPPPQPKTQNSLDLEAANQWLNEYLKARGEFSDPIPLWVQEKMITAALAGIAYARGEKG